MKARMATSSSASVRQGRASLLTRVQLNPGGPLRCPDAHAEPVVPAVSPERVKLWSYADLMGLRIIYWLRQRKTDATGAEIPPTSMRHHRRTIVRLERCALNNATAR
jgi:hypothetical protein